MSEKTSNNFGWGENLSLIFWYEHCTYGTELYKTETTFYTKCGNTNLTGKISINVSNDCDNIFLLSVTT